MIKHVIILFLSLLPLACPAQLVESKGIGEIVFQGIQPTVKEVANAMRAAQLDALGRYTAELSPTMQEEYRSMQSYCEANLDQYVKTVLTLDRQEDKKLKALKIVIRAEINTGKLKGDFKAQSKVAQLTSDHEKSTITFVFLSRKAQKVKTYGDRKTVDSTSTQGQSAKDEVTTDGGFIQKNSQLTQGQTATTGSSTETLADAVTYVVASSDDLDGTVSRIFSTAGFELANASDLFDDGLIGAFKKDFSQGEDASASTRQAAAKLCRDSEVKFMAIGKMDIDRNLTDPASGLVRVFVNVNAKVMNLTKKVPTTAASIGPVQFSGLGPTQSVAERNALQQAAEKASEDLVSQMRTKGLF